MLSGDRPPCVSALVARPALIGALGWNILFDSWPELTALAFALAAVLGLPLAILRLAGGLIG
jgi:hypothetical protein